MGNNVNLVLGPFDESTPCLMIVLMNCQTKLRINHLAAVKLVAILEKPHWYQCSRPGGSLTHGFNRQEQFLLPRFQSCHLKTMKFSEGFKSFEMCTNCSSEPASSTHILECLGLTKQNLAEDLLLVLYFLVFMKSWTWSSTAGQWRVQQQQQQPF
ncbi:uncharacterized protein TNCV_4914161 [Trichonephila clavipes]|nr:uncharacterized protein TNCV_4914161 [Trichonephila clavipes]